MILPDFKKIKEEKLEKNKEFTKWFKENEEILINEFIFDSPEEFEEYCLEKFKTGELE